MNKRRLGLLAAELRHLTWLEDAEWKTGDPACTTPLQPGVRLQCVTDFDAGTVHQKLTPGDALHIYRTAGNAAGVAAGIFAEEIDERLRDHSLQLRGNPADRVRQAAAAVLELDAEQAAVLFRHPPPATETAPPGPGAAATAVYRTANGERGPATWRTDEPAVAHSARAPRATPAADRKRLRKELRADTLPQTGTVFDVCERIAAVPGIVWTADQQGGIRGTLPGPGQRRPVWQPDPHGLDGGRWDRRAETTYVRPIAAISWQAEEDVNAAVEVTRSPWDTIDEMALAPAGMETGETERDELGYSQRVRALHVFVGACDRRPAERFKALTLGSHPLQAGDKMSGDEWLAAADRTAQAMYAYTAWLLTGRDPQIGVPEQAAR